MTIAIGMLAADGLLLCADTLYSDGTIREYRQKIFSYSGRHAVVGFALAGNEAIARMAIDDSIDALGNSKRPKLSLNNILSTIRPIVKRVYEGYVETKHPGRDREVAEFSLIIAIATLSDERLYTSVGAALSPITSFDVVGCGRDLGFHILRDVHDSHLTIDEASILAIHALAAAKQYMDGIGGRTQFLSIRNKCASSIVPHDIAASENIVINYRKNTTRLLLGIGDPSLDDDQFRDHLQEFVRYVQNLRADWGVEAPRWIELRKHLSPQVNSASSS